MKKNVLSVFSLLLGLAVSLPSCVFDQMEEEGILSGSGSKSVELRELEKMGIHCITGNFDDWFVSDKVEELERGASMQPGVTMEEMLSIVSKFGVDEWQPFDVLGVSDHIIEFDREEFRWTAGLHFSENISLNLYYDVTKHIPDITNYWFDLSMGQWQCNMPMVYFRSGRNGRSHTIYDINYWYFNLTSYMFFKVLNEDATVDYYFTEICFQGRLNPDDVEGEFYHRLKNDTYKNYKFEKQ